MLSEDENDFKFEVITLLFKGSINPNPYVEVCELNQQYQLKARTNLSLICYYINMFSAFIFLNTYMYPQSFSMPWDDGKPYTIKHRDFLVFSQILSFPILIIFTIIVQKSNPGYLPKVEIEDEKARNEAQFKLLQTNNPNLLCFECLTQRKPKSRHCYMCNRCVESFDHHSSVMNNCIGYKNYELYFMFTASQTIYTFITVTMFITTLFIKDEGRCIDLTKPF